jgi:hypothetical protein
MDNEVIGLGSPSAPKQARHSRWGNVFAGGNFPDWSKVAAREYAEPNKGEVDELLDRCVSLMNFSIAP